MNKNGKATFRTEEGDATFEEGGLNKENELI